MTNNEVIIYQSKLIRALRQFFYGENFLDVMPPQLVECPVIEPHIQVMEVQSYKDKLPLGFLHTSPEFWMKDLLARGDGFEKIFSINYCFRDEPNSPDHRNQFLMLEWYRQNESYIAIEDDIRNLLTTLKDHLDLNEFNSKVETISVAELFKDKINCDILNLLETDELIQYIKKDHSDVPLPSAKCDWDDYYHLLFLNKVEPHLNNLGNIILKDYPAPLSALSRINKNDSRVCERFELYMNGREVANCYSELTDVHEQRSRANEFNETRQRNYSHKMPEPKRLFNALEKGIPESAGIALGIERLFMSLYNSEKGFWN